MYASQLEAGVAALRAEYGVAAPFEGDPQQFNGFHFIVNDQDGMLRHPAVYLID
jgi:hypothetical protein